ncbi:MAG: hypothetical protein VYC34_05050, partial [Planctomycetota bacterium]|nr:hypothetical protein [Planctomycetota bacterium]
AWGGGLGGPPGGGGGGGAATTTSGGEVNQPVEPEAPRAEVPDDWTAAPEALYAALVRSYENELGGTARDTEGEKRRYLNDARRWARLHSQRMRETVEWRVRVVEVEAQGNGAIATLEVIEPGSGLPIGDAFEMELRPREAAKVQEAPDQEMWTMTGVFVAKPTVDEESGEDRVFSARKLIGPFIAFDWEFNVRALTP